MYVQRSNSTGKLAFSKQRHPPVRIARAQPAAQSRHTPSELLLYTQTLGGTHPRRRERVSLVPTSMWRPATTQRFSILHFQDFNFA